MSESNQVVEFPTRKPDIEADNGWQPIDTAPKDKLILAGWFNSLGKWRSEHARYYGPRELPLDDYAFEESEIDDDYAPPGWYGGGLECERLYDIRPTHWQPLPPPPTEQTKS